MRKILFLLVLVFVTSTLSLGLSYAQEDMPAPTGLRPDAPLYAVRGDYPVGTMEMTLDNADRPLPYTIWYPALNADGMEESHTYVMNYPGALEGLEVHGQAIFEAEPDVEHGPYPLVIFAHGFLGVRAGYIYFVEQLASQGFVVVAADHVGTTINSDISAPDSVWSMLYTIPHDFSLIIDEADTLNSDGVLAGMINTDLVAVGGHSAGGFSALIAAGARLDLNYLADECAQGLDKSDCELFVPYLQEIAESIGLEALPEGLWPSVGDDRIDAVITMAADQYSFGAEGLNSITVPALYFTGSADQSVTPEEYMTGFASLGADASYMVELDNAIHGVYINACDDIPMLVEWGAFGVCADPVWDRNRAHDLIDHYATAFLRWHLLGDDEAATVFADDAETFIGINLLTH